MAKVKASVDLGNVDTFEDLKRYLTNALIQIVDNVNGNLLIGDNINMFQTSVTFSTANAEKRIEHGLNKVPTGYILAGSSAAMSLYDGSTANTDEFIYLKSSATGTAKILIY